MCFSVITDHLQVWYKHIYHIYKKLHHSVCLKADSSIFLPKISNVFTMQSITHTHKLLFLCKTYRSPCLNTLNITIYKCCVCACITWWQMTVKQNSSPLNLNFYIMDDPITSLKCYRTVGCQDISRSKRMTEGKYS
jgi:hypothetical protein